MTRLRVIFLFWFVGPITARGKFFFDNLFKTFLCFVSKFEEQLFGNPVTFCICLLDALVRFCSFVIRHRKTFFNLKEYEEVRASGVI